MRKFVVIRKQEKLLRKASTCDEQPQMLPKEHLNYQDFYKNLLIITLAVVGFFSSLLAFWPGFMEYDSYMQYGQAIGILPLENWHPASMTLLWRALITICNGPQPMLLFQCLFYWSGFLYLALWLWRNTSKFMLALTAILVPFFPFLINFTGVIWKDTHMAVALFWAALLLVFGRRSWSKLLISLLLIFYGLSVRHNGIAAAMPLLILWSYRYLRYRNLNIKYGVLLVSIAMLFVYFMVNFGMNRFFSVEKTISPEEQRLNDIVFIKCNLNSGDFGVLERFYGETLIQIAPDKRQVYLCDQVSLLASTDDTGIIFDQEILNIDTQSKEEQILGLWTRSVISHPLLYLEYRLRVYRTFLRPLSYPEPYYVLLDGMDDINPLPVELSFEVLNPFGLTTLLIDYVTFFSSSKYYQLPFRPFFWLITLLLTTMLSAYKRQYSVCLIAASGLLYIISFFPVLPAPDFRYCYYSMFAQILSIYIGLDRHYSRLIPFLNQCGVANTSSPLSELTKLA
jgi:hypothetical protein